MIFKPFQCCWNILKTKSSNRVEKLLFSVAGVPASSKKPDTLSGIRRIRELGLDGMELEFVNGVRMKEEKAAEAKALSRSLAVALTAHAPYYVNLNAAEPEKLQSSRSHLMQTARMAFLAGAVSFTFHPAYYLKEDPEEVYRRVKSEIQSLKEEIAAAGYDLLISPETTGKPTAFGSLEELLRLAEDLPGLNLCVDFAHLHARSGGAFNSYDEFSGVLQKIKQASPALLENLHMHVSGIEYSVKGEKKHLPLKESDFKYRELLKALKDFQVKGILVCESPILEEDALLLKETSEKL